MRPVHFALSVAMIATVPPLEAATYFTVTSTSMKDGARMPSRFAADDPKRPCRPGSTEICPCPGQNVSPQLAEGDGSAGRKFTGGNGTRGNANYLGPCPPRGDGQHHYLITVMALDIEPTLAPGLTREAFLAAVKGHQLAASSIGGLFARAYE